MAITDHEAVLEDLKVHLRGKDSHGRKDLADVIQELEAKHRVKEGLPEMALRLHGVDLSDLSKQHDSDEEPSSSLPAGASANGT